VSLRFEGEGFDTTITDPQAGISVEDLPTLPPRSEVTVTVTTNASDDIVFLLSRDRRIRLNSSGGNSYRGTFTVPRASGCQHFGVSALSHETLNDDTAPYDSESWLFPIKARGSGGLAQR